MIRKRKPTFEIRNRKRKPANEILLSYFIAYFNLIDKSFMLEAIVYKMVGYHLNTFLIYLLFKRSYIEKSNSSLNLNGSKSILDQFSNSYLTEPFSIDLCS